MSGNNPDNKETVSSNSLSTNQNGGDLQHLEMAPPPDHIPLVFFQESSLFGSPKRNPNDYIKHEEMYKALGSVIQATHITGLQRVNGMWRIYLDDLEDKATLITCGVTLRGKTLPILKSNPLRLDSEQFTRIRIQDIPLSVDDGLIDRVLVVKGLNVISCMREKLRINGKLTNCATGDRLVNVKTSSLKRLDEPLPRTMQFANFKAKVIYKGQRQNNGKTTCGKCLTVGHSMFQCESVEWRCSTCLELGHRSINCTVGAIQSAPKGSQANCSNASQISDSSADESAHESVYESRKNTNVNSLDDTPSSRPDSPLSTQGKIKRRKKKAKSSTKTQPQLAHQSRIDQFMKTPNRTNPSSAHKSGSVTRSPPTPAEILNDITKKACIDNNS